MSIEQYGHKCVSFQVMESYAAIIEHCIQVNFSKLANHYFSKAIS